MTAILLITTGSTSFTNSLGQTYEIGRLNIGALNPISMGHVGVTAFLLGMSIIVTREREHRAMIFGLAAISIGAALTVMANSRGPIVSLAAVLVFFIFARSRRRSTYWLLGIFPVVASYILFQYPDIIFGDGGPFSRFMTVSRDGDAASLARFTSFRGALDQFIGSPVYGDGVEERITKQYPHNVILEAFMATGVLGGVPFLLLVVVAIRAAWGLLRINSKIAWVGLVVMQQLVGSQFSGSIWGAGTMWVMMMLVIVCWRYERPVRSTFTENSNTLAPENTVRHPSLAKMCGLMIHDQDEDRRIDLL